MQTTLPFQKMWYQEELTSETTLSLSKTDFLGAILLTILSFSICLVALGWAMPSTARSALYPSDPAWFEAPKHFNSLYWTTPYEPYHPDESFLLDALSEMSPSELDFNPNFFNYPSLSIYLTGVALKSAEIVGYVSIVNDKTFYLENPEEMARLYTVGRVLAASMSSITVGLLYLLVRMLHYRRGFALLAAITLGIAPLWVRNSQFLLVNVPSVMWVLATAVFAVIALRQRRLWPLIVSALLCGLGASTRYGAGACVIMPIYAALQLVFGEQDQAKKRKHPATILLVPIVSILGFFVGSPYILFDFDSFLQAVQFESSTKIGLASPMLVFEHMVYALGLPLSVLAIAGWAMLLRRWREWQTHIAIMLLVSGMAQRFLSDAPILRYIIPAMPALALGAAYAIDQSRRWVRERQGDAVAWAVALILLFPALGFSANILQLMNQPLDVRTKAGNLIDARVPQGTQIGVYHSIYYSMPPLDADKYQIDFMGKLAESENPPIIIMTSQTEDLWGGELPPADYEMVQLTQRPHPAWTWPVNENRPNDWGFTFLDIFIYHAPDQTYFD